MIGHAMRNAGSAALAVLALAAAGAAQAQAQSAAGVPYGIADRGEGISTSLLGTYVKPREFVFYPFYEYTKTRKFEYKASDFKLPGTVDYFGKTAEHEVVVFLGYGLGESLVVEFESVVHSRVDFTRAPDDPGPVPARIRESGLGDTEAQVRWRLYTETQTRPDTTLFFKTVFPLQRSKLLLGTQNWEFSPGFAVSKGYSFGTFSLRAAALYDRADRKWKAGEYAIDYLRRLGPDWRMVLSVEGVEREFAFVGEFQYRLASNAILKLNCGFGISSTAPSFAPEIGVLFHF